MELAPDRFGDGDRDQLKYAKVIICAINKTYLPTTAAIKMAFKS